MGVGRIVFKPARRRFTSLDRRRCRGQNLGVPPPITPAAFIAKWQRVTLSERAVSQEHFIDLCRLLGQPTPAEHDATGAEYTFEKGVRDLGGPASTGSQGERGFADAWWRGKFAWEYKRKDKYRDLTDAYRQLCQYREALDSPPLLIVSDIARTEIHTNFTGTRKEVHVLPLADLDKPENLDKLRRVFTDPESFKPTLTTATITEEAAAQFAHVAAGLRDRGHDAHEAAHFLMKSMFCLFAEDVGLLPPGIMKRLLRRDQYQPEKLTPRLTELFRVMRTGGDFGTDEIAYFNGGLFDDAPALELRAGEVGAMLAAAEHDWGAVEPAIFGTLFERSLDPGKRAQIGAHYTSRQDIMLIVEPVIRTPLRREWRAVREDVEGLIEKRRKATSKPAKKKADDLIAKRLDEFLHRLGSIRILDPACGSGNFLYVAIQQLLDLEKEVTTFTARPDIALGLLPRVRPTQLHGIEINAYAAELAQVVIWIGYLQWMRDNGFVAPSDPILEPLQTIECRDAILDFLPLPANHTRPRRGPRNVATGERGEPVESDPQQQPAPNGGGGNKPSSPVPAQWPEADFIIGNPPFLGSKVFRQQGLDEAYVQAMYAVYDLPKTSDLCCYWFELARRAIERKSDTRCGLLATQGIRGGDNRTVLERIKQTGDIFMAWSDRQWILDGAAVHVSMVGFDDSTEASRTLDGASTPNINSDLSAGAATSEARPLSENRGVCFQGQVVVGPFDIDQPTARRYLSSPNPGRGRNVDVILPLANAKDLTGRSRGEFIVDFGVRTLNEAAQYEAPLEHVRKHVKPLRDKNADRQRRQRWWQHGRAGTNVRSAIAPLSRQLISPRVSKHRLFVWERATTRATDAAVVFARADDYFFGVLHSSIHELWALRMGTQLEDRPRYTPTTCFETFALPWAPGHEPTDHPVHQRISAAACELNELRERWLNPPEWIGPLAAAIDAGDDFADVPPEARPLIRESAIMAAAAQDPQLKKRTLTNLYNERPTWLRLAHERLDRAVLAAYAAVDPAGEWAEDWAQIWIDTGAGQPLPDAHPLAARRRDLDQRVLSNLLRLNLERGLEP